MRRFLTSLVLSALALAGCHAQVPPTPAQAVYLTWTVPAAGNGWAGCGTGQPACTYVVSRAVLAAGVATCPVPNVTTPNYAPLNSASPATGTD